MKFKVKGNILITQLKVGHVISEKDPTYEPYMDYNFMSYEELSAIPRIYWKVVGLSKDITKGTVVLTLERADIPPLDVSCIKDIRATFGKGCNARIKKEINIQENIEGILEYNILTIYTQI